MTQATKHKATKIEAGHYIYRGQRIEKAECKAEGYLAWNMFDEDDCCYDAAPTLSSAKYMIDCGLDVE